MFKEILLPLDLEATELSERAIVAAQDLAERYQARITVITVIPDFGLPLVANYFPDDALGLIRKEISEELRRMIDARFRSPNGVRQDIREGSPHKAIVAYARDHKIDLIIMPSRAKDISKVFLGASAAHVVERAPCSVLVVRP